MNYKKRCELCTNLKVVNGFWQCEECFNQLCKDIDDCPLGITTEQIIETENIKVKNYAHSTKERKKTVKEHKPDIDKEYLIKSLKDFLDTLALKNIEITNISKTVEFNYNDNHYKLDLIKQRKTKK